MRRGTVIAVILGATLVFGLLGGATSVLTIYGMQRVTDEPMSSETCLALMLAPPGVGLVFGLVLGCLATMWAAMFGRDKPRDP